MKSDKIRTAIAAVFLGVVRLAQFPGLHRMMFSYFDLLRPEKLWPVRAGTERTAEGWEAGAAFGPPYGQVVFVRRIGCVLGGRRGERLRQSGRSGEHGKYVSPVTRSALIFTDGLNVGKGNGERWNGTTACGW